MNRIRQLRQLKGYSQKELGEKINRTTSAISKWELEQRELSKEDRRLLCLLFGVTSDYLMGLADINDYKAELYGEKLPKPLRDVGLERVELLREYIDENGGIHPDVQRELLRLVAEAKLLSDTDGHSQ